MHVASTFITLCVWVGSRADAQSILDGLKQRQYGTEYHMPYVRVIHARPQSDKPQLVKGHFVSTFGGYNASLDTVNNGNLEGALTYIQADCINEKLRDKEDRCVRKYMVKYLVFYEILIAQTNETITAFKDSWTLPEYGPLVPMSSGQCTPSSDGSFPSECLQFNGDAGQPNLGPFVGGREISEDERAPYKDAYWFSFPHTCPKKMWSDKTDACRASTRKGLCDLGTAPDGVECTFAYDILGWVPLDDAVGITQLKDGSGNYYKNFSSWCQDSIDHVEFSSDDGIKDVVSLPFWSEPTDSTSNAKRAAKVVELYQKLVSGVFKSSQVDSQDLAAFRELPSPEDLAANNPPCYMTVPSCNTDYGCERKGYAQICTPCTSASAKCVTDPSFVMPLSGNDSAATNQTSAVPSPSDRLKTSDQATSKPSNETGSKAPLIAGSVGGVVAVIIIAAILVIRAKKKASTQSPTVTNLPPLDDVSNMPRDQGAPSMTTPFAAVVGSPTRHTSSMNRSHGMSSPQKTATNTNSTHPSSKASSDQVVDKSKPTSTDVWDDPVIKACRVPYSSIFFGRLLSRGGFGEVYMGTYNGEAVAIKQLLPHKRRDLAEIDTFLAEVKLMTSLEHERIVRFIAVAWNALSDVCVVAEYMENGDLRSVLTRWNDAEKRAKGFDADKTKIALHIAHALTYLHSLQPIVVHRDLKSKNILLNADYDAKLTDFGVSRERADSTMTANVGSSLWMAPEVMMGERYDEKADIFSFGVVLSELDTQQLPYAHAKEPAPDQRVPEAAILQMVMLGRLSIVFSDATDPALQQLGRDCVSLDPKKRPTAAQMLHRVHQLYRRYL